MDTPKIIEALLAKRVFYIACGSSHSAAITSVGELYTWGQGQYGRLGHGDEISKYTPELVSYLTYIILDNSIKNKFSSFVCVFIFYRLKNLLGKISRE